MQSSGWPCPYAQLSKDEFVDCRLIMFVVAVFSVYRGDVGNENLSSAAVYISETLSRKGHLQVASQIKSSSTSMTLH